MQLSDKKSETLIHFKVEEIEYDRAEGAGVSIDIKSFNLKGIFHNIWLERIFLAQLALQLQDFQDQKTNIVHSHLDCLDLAFERNTNNELLCGIQIRRDFSSRIKDFPIEFSLSFEIEDSVVTNFLNELKKLEASCRAW
jgi:hypothetical protein